ncbi:hypothetical protein [Microbacterium caowuchunii]|uniref:Uncharacterized protein n=1 Tax=Microbacterium caowuchunii TaxID=2614638 RepID=A0A5N0TCG8_9MICO|nr:hypothetical protein [Microbacterium caowuchunii]KAA9132368.1 hypothetical protein F6B40_11810 [Microbacterium caowuchunii]
MQSTISRADVRRIERQNRSRRRSAARRAKMREARLRRQLSPRPHWSVYLAATLLGLGVLALVAAALLSR